MNGITTGNLFSAEEKKYSDEFKATKRRKGFTFTKLQDILPGLWTGKKIDKLQWVGLNVYQTR